MQSRRVKVGVLGGGGILGAHGPALRKAAERGEVVAVAEPMPARDEAIHKLLGPDVTIVRDYHEVLAMPEIEAVDILLPHHLHLPATLDAAAAGKHVIIEKPLEVTLARCDRIIAACERAGVVLSTIFPSRFHESAQLLKRAIDQKRFGRLTIGDAYVKWYRTQEYYDSGAWRGTWRLDGGGALMNQAIHSVDLLSWLMGPVQDLSARTATLAHERIEVEDVALATHRYENGALGVIEATTAAYPGALKRIEIHGSAGSAVLQEEDITTWSFARPTRADAALLRRMAGKTKTGGGAADPAAIGHHGHTAQFKDVLQAIKTGRQPLINGPEGRRSVEIILAIYKAAESGRTVTLPLKTDPKLQARRR